MSEELVRNVSKTLATTSSVIMDSMPPNSRRKQFILTNTSALGEAITIAHGADAIAGKGIVLYPTFTYQESRGADYQPFQGKITALGSAATATLAIHEVVEVNL